MGISISHSTVGITVELDPYALPLAGGSMSGTLHVPTIRNLLNENLVVDAYNDDAAGTHSYFKFNPWNGLELSQERSLLNSVITREKIEFSETDGAGIGKLTKDELTFEDGVSDVKIEASKITLNNGAGLIYHDGANDARLTFGDGLQYKANYGVSESLWGQGYINFADANGTTELSSTGITFADSTQQTTAGLPLTGGTLTGNLVLSNDVYASGVSKTISGNAVSGDSYVGYEIGSDTASGSQGSALKIKFGNTDEGYENQAILQQNGLTFKEAIGDIIFARYGQGGITFPDATVQTTAGLPLTGGEMSGSLEITGNGYTILNNEKLLINKEGYPIELFSDATSSGIRFGDSSTQTTAGLPLTGGTMSGNIVLQNDASVWLNGAGYNLNIYIAQDEGILFRDDNGNNLGGFSPQQGITFADATTQTTAGLPLTGGTVSGAVLFDAVLVTFGGNGAHFQNSDGEVDISGSGITFPDGVTQTTAGIPEAPQNGGYYVRKDGAWVQCTVYTNGGRNYLTV